MPKAIEMSSELEAQIRLIDGLRDEFYRTDLREVTVTEALAPLRAGIEGLRVLLPEVAAKAHGFYFTDEYLDRDDYERVYEGAALCAMYVMMTEIGLDQAANFSDFESSLNSLADDLSDLRSYTAGWDWEHGVWAESAAA